VSRPVIVPVFVPFLVLLIVVLTGCGGGGPIVRESRASKVEKPLTPKSFTQEIQRLCRIALRERAPGFDYVNDYGYPTGAEERKLVENVLLPPVKKAVRGIEALDMPKGEERVTRLMAMFGKGIRQIEAHPEMLLDGSALSKADYWSMEWGLSECGQV
jgi:hypothetical protein